MISPSASQPPHGPDWAQRLEEWSDDRANPSEAAAIETHIASCSECQDYLDALKDIDGALRSILRVPSVSAAFDAGVWSRIESNDEIQRALAKQRARDEMREHLEALDTGWRRKLLLMIPGVFAGMALALWTVSLVSGSGLVVSVATMLQQQFGGPMAQFVQTMITALTGGALGLAMSQWIVPTSD